MPHCLRWALQAVSCANCLARDKPGSNKLARIAIITITTSSSISVKPIDREARWIWQGCLKLPLAHLRGRSGDSWSPAFRTQCPGDEPPPLRKMESGAVKRCRLCWKDRSGMEKKPGWGMAWGHRSPRVVPPAGLAWIGGRSPVGIPWRKTPLAFPSIARSQFIGYAGGCPGSSAGRYYLVGYQTSHWRKRLLCVDRKKARSTCPHAASGWQPGSMAAAWSKACYWEQWINIPTLVRLQVRNPQGSQFLRNNCAPNHRDHSGRSGLSRRPRAPKIPDRATDGGGAPFLSEPWPGTPAWLAIQAHVGLEHSSPAKTDYKTDPKRSLEKKVVSAYHQVNLTIIHVNWHMIFSILKKCFISFEPKW